MGIPATRLNNPKIFVTGGTGFIGSHLIEVLLAKGYAVRCLVRQTSNTRWLKTLDVEFVHGSLSDPDSFLPFLSDVEYIFHVAGITKAKRSQEYFRANAESTKNLLTAAVHSGAPLKRFVLVSSLAAVGPSLDGVPVDELTPYHPITAYGKSKMAAEQYCHAVLDQIPITIIRPPAVYGPRDRDIYALFKLISHSIRPIMGSRKASLIYVRDLVEGIVMAAEHAATTGKTYFLADDRVYDWNLLGVLIANALGKRTVAVRIPKSIALGVGCFVEATSIFSSKPPLLNLEKVRDLIQPNWTCSARRAHEDFGFSSQTPIERGVAETVAWYKTAGWL
jgi:nucleoside-diphosphate-sugar epimerase